MTFWATEAMAMPLSGEEMKLRDRFVEQYLFDYDGKAAALRVGFSPSFAEQYATQFLDEPYVRQKIAERQKQLAEDTKLEDEQSKRQIRAMLMREANYRGPGSSHAARVAAMSKLMSLYDMDAPVKTKNVHEHRGGVMAVPGIAAVEDWEKEAARSQEKLQTDSVVGPQQGS